MVSIVDIARAVGLSDKTVSRVVNKEANVKPETVRRVEEAIQALGYVPNLGARMTRTNKSRTFGILTDFISTTPYSGEIVRGIQSWAHANGRTILLANTDGDPEREKDAWRTFREHRIDGVLYVTMYHRIVEFSGESLPIPTVLVNCRAEHGSAIPSVTPDDAGGSAFLTEFLLRKGHRRIAYIRLNPSLHGAEQRFHAFEAVVTARGVPRDDILVRIGMTGPVGAEENRVFDIAAAIFSAPQRPTAVMCGNDEMAMQVYLAALTAGLKIPADVSIVGFDDFRTISIGLKPQLTTAALPYFDLGHQGAERLDRVLSGERLDPINLSLPCKLVERGSCRDIR